MQSIFLVRREGCTFFDEDGAWLPRHRLGCSPDRLPLYFDAGRKALIFVRKTLYIRLRNQKMQSIFLVRREGCTFFDEDGAWLPRHRLGGSPDRLYNHPPTELW